MFRFILLMRFAAVNCNFLHPRHNNYHRAITAKLWRSFLVMRSILYGLLLFSLSLPATAQISITQSLQLNPMLYGFGLLVIVMWIIFQGIPLYKKITRFTKAITGKIYTNKSSRILQTQYRKLALGAIYSE